MSASDTKAHWAAAIHFGRNAFVRQVIQDAWEKELALHRRRRGGRTRRDGRSASRERRRVPTDERSVIMEGADIPGGGSTTPRARAVSQIEIRAKVNEPLTRPTATLSHQMEEGRVRGQRRLDSPCFLLPEDEPAHHREAQQRCGRHRDDFGDEDIRRQPVQ